jgi:hypothetical protein
MVKGLLKHDMHYIIFGIDFNSKIKLSIIACQNHNYYAKIAKKVTIILCKKLKIVTVNVPIRLRKKETWLDLKVNI